MNALAAGQLLLTTARFCNRPDPKSPSGWRKVLAHGGPYTQYAYGTDTPGLDGFGYRPGDGDGPLQVAVLCCPSSGLFAVDVDNAAAFASSQAAGHVSRADACSTRGDHFHVLVDARHIDRALWPRQGPTGWGDIKSNGFIPLPGSAHCSGAEYEPAGGGVVTATPELIAALAADRGAYMRPPSASGGSGSPAGSGHDSDMAAAVFGWVHEGLPRDEVRRRWREKADAEQDPGWPYEDADFERHYRGAARKYEQALAHEAEVHAQIGISPARQAAARLNGQAPAQPQPDSLAAEPAEPEGPPAPLRPGLDALAGTLLSGHEFARDAGGELFLLPGPGLPHVPYIPRSFLTADVLNLGHDLWRQMAIAWNSWRVQHPDAGGKAVAYTPSDTLIRNVVRHLEALGTEYGRRVVAELRAIRRDGGREIIIDLGDGTGEVVRVTAGGWTVTDPRALPGGAPVFRRSTGYGPLPRPEHGGDLAGLWRILRIDGGNPALATARNLFAGWLTAAYFADVPRPGLWLTGPAGAGKTTIATGLARLIDGTEWLDGRLDKTDERNNIIRAAKCYVVSFDNMSMVTSDLSDWICHLVTGHRDTFRKMRTNFEDISMAYRRTFVATGLSLPYGLAADALDRVIEVQLTAIADAGRVDETLIRRELDEARPRLLGALLDRVAAVLRVLPQIPAQGTGLARMHGYAQVLVAHDAVYGQGGAPCLSAYLGSVKAVREGKAEGEPVVAALTRAIAPGAAWEGIAKELQAELMRHRDFSLGADAWWPADPQRLSDKLTELDGVLRESGFIISRRTGHGKARLITIARQPDPGP